MLVFSNANLEICLFDSNAQAVPVDQLTPTIACRCWVDEDSENLRDDYGDGTASTAAVSITIDKNSVGNDEKFSPVFVRYQHDHKKTISNWRQVKSVIYYDIVQSIKIVCL